jgi:hypothetical protein
MKISTRQSGTISDNDGPYIPGEDDCSWIIAPTGATRIHLVISKLQLGGLEGKDHEELQIAVCQDIHCRNPVDIQVQRSPFNEKRVSQLTTCFLPANYKVFSYLLTASITTRTHLAQRSGR